MKKGESFQLNYTWWKDAKPMLLTDTGLGKALEEFHKADNNFMSKKNLATFGLLMKAIDAVDDARKKGVEKCGTNPLLTDAKEALKKDAAIGQRKTVVKAAITSKLDEIVKKAEEELATELVAVERAKHTWALTKSIVEKALQGTDKKVLEKAGSELGARYENLQGVAGAAARFAKDHAADLGPYVSQFPTHLERLKVVIQKSMANLELKKDIAKYALEKKDILTIS